MKTQAPLMSITPDSEAALTSNKPSVVAKVFVVASMMMAIGGTLTGVMTYMNIGFSDGFFSRWLSSFALAALFMVPVAMGMITLLTKLITRLLPDKSEKARNLLIGLIMAVVMESVMAFMTAANNIGFADLSTFTSGWFNGFLAALPVGLTIIVVMSMTVKPKIERFLKS